MAYSFKNLVFEGGGVKGIAYVGAMKVLDAKGILPNIKRVGGTSAGAINAALLGLNYSLQDTEKILRTLDFKKMLDDSFGVVRDTNRLINQFGWYKGDYFRDWIGGVIKEKTGNSEATFNDVFSLKAERNFRDLYFVGTNLSTGFAEVFSYERTPRWCVADAVRISMSIPLFFSARYSPRGDCYVDGGMLDNYPIKLFDRDMYVDEHCVRTDYYETHNSNLAAENKQLSHYVYNQETLGFRLDTAKEIAVFRDQAEPPQEKVNDFFDYVRCLIRAILNSQDSGHLHGDDWQRTIYIDTLGVKTTDFDLSDERKQALIDSGEQHTARYFTWYDDPNQRPVNRPKIED
jgi:NTE family protein